MLGSDVDAFEIGFILRHRGRVFSLENSVNSVLFEFPRELAQFLYTICSVAASMGEKK